MKELLEIILSDDINSDGYDLYINSKDEAISQTAEKLKQIEQEQEPKRFSLFNGITSKKDLKKNFRSITKTKDESSQNSVPSDIHILDNIEPEK